MGLLHPASYIEPPEIVRVFLLTMAAQKWTLCTAGRHAVAHRIKSAYVTLKVMSMLLIDISIFRETPT